MTATSVMAEAIPEETESTLFILSLRGVITSKVPSLSPVKNTFSA